MRWGNCINFLKEYFPEESKSLYFNSGKKDIATTKWPGLAYCSNPLTVKNIWIKCYNKVGKDQFFFYEHSYIITQFYNKIKIKILPYLNLDKTNRAFQECFWSWALHRGINGAYKEFLETINNINIKSISNEQLFDLIYNTRYKYFTDNRYKMGLSTSERETLRPLLTISGLKEKEEQTNTMKYNENNKPLICMMTNSTCYKGTGTMKPLGILWHSTGANNKTLKRYVQPSENDNNYKQLLEIIGKNKYGNDWNHIYRKAGVNAWIGELANGEITSIQAMPWNYRPWGCGSGKKGSCNSGWI